MEKTALLKVAEEAFYASQLEKDADYRKIPFVKTFMGSVGEGTMDLWRRQYNWASRATTQEATKFYNKLTEAGKKATGEGYTAINGTQHILRSMHSIDGPRIPYNPKQGGMPLPMPKQASYSGLELAKLAMSTRLVREIQKGGVKVTSPSSRAALAQRYGAVNKQHDPLADKLYNAITQGKVDPKGMTKQRFDDLKHDANPSMNTDHRSIGMTLGTGYEGIASVVLTDNNGLAVRKAFKRPLSNIQDRFNHMNSNPDIYPKMFGYKKDQPMGMRIVSNGETTVKAEPSEAMFMELVPGNDLRNLPIAEQKKGYQQLGDKLKAKGYMKTETPYNGPGEAFFNPTTGSEINDLHGGNIRMTPEGKAVIIDPIQRSGLGPEEHSRLHEITPNAFKSQGRAGWDESRAWTTPQQNQAGTGNVNPAVNPSFAVSKSIPRSEGSQHGMADIFLHGKQPDQSTPVAFTGSAKSDMVPEGMKHTLPKPMSDGMSASENNSNRAINQNQQGRTAEKQTHPNTEGAPVKPNGQDKPKPDVNQKRPQFRSWEERKMYEDHKAFRARLDAVGKPPQN